MPTLNDQLLAGLFFARSNLYKKKLDFAISGIQKMFLLCNKLNVGLSFGKQSICIAHMVYQMRPQTPMFFLSSSETWFLDNYFDVIEKFLKICPINLTIIQTNRMCIDIDGHIQKLRKLGINVVKRGWNKTRPSSWEESRKTGKNDIQQLLYDRRDYDGWLWGLSKDESHARRMTLIKQYKNNQLHPSIYKYRDGKYRCCPIMNWSIDSLSAYLSTNKLPLLNAYHEAGLQARTTARITGTASRMMAFERMRRLEPDGYNILVNCYPELGLKT